MKPQKAWKSKKWEKLDLTDIPSHDTAEREGIQDAKDTAGPVKGNNDDIKHLGSQLANTESSTKNSEHASTTHRTPFTSHSNTDAGHATRDRLLIPDSSLDNSPTDSDDTASRYEDGDVEMAHGRRVSRTRETHLGRMNTSKGGR